MIVRVLILLTMLSTSAAGEGRVLPAHTKIELPAGADVFVLDGTYFLVSRDAIDAANQSAELNRQLTDKLVSCVKQKTPEKSSESGLVTALRWGSVGALLVGSFMLGLAVGR